MGLLVVLGIDLCDLCVGRTMIQRIVLYAVLGYTLDTLGTGFDHWGFWCILGLFWASEHMTRRELIEQLNLELQEMRRKAGIDNKDNK
jgi:hypothetical protein